MDIGISARLRPILDEVKRFIDTGILPLEREFLAEIASGDRWAFTPRQIEILEGLKARARSLGLWNFFLTEHDGGHGLTTVEYAYIAEETGKSHLAPEVFNCSAPDTGN
ncbi:MAG: acyl-CoA dehydrogenase family protein, partial [Pseudomonadales bacterium]|nr:acyl-CoA dehydrogenase family protein [Pseudomonadales bacterium]